MKNTIIIDVDTDRQEVIKIYKPDLTLTENDDDVKKLLLKDIACITETLGILFDKLGEVTDKTYDDLIDEAVQQLKIRDGK